MGDPDASAVSNVTAFLEIEEKTKEYIQKVEDQRNFFHQQYLRKCEHEFEVRNLNEKLEEALRSINSRLSDCDSWLAQSIDCRNIAEAALGEKDGNQHD
jgi:tRNA(Ser,Leu) C12 N-acetylase TAN1